ncbi:MAG: hypothetical protein JXA57_13540 [Armatimonadetes bacterium]|nr:hypothetical protein [Armatimonadota bacterium]
MAEEIAFRITVTYTDGTKETFDIDAAGGDATTFAGRVNQILGGSTLQLGLEEGLLVIPMTSLKHLEISPALPSLPAAAVKNVRRADA